MACDPHVYGNKAFCIVCCDKASMCVTEATMLFSPQNRSVSSQIMIKEACKSLSKQRFRVHQCSFKSSAKQCGYCLQLLLCGNDNMI